LIFAYADATTNEARERSRKVVRHAATEGGSQTGGAVLSRPFDQQTLITVLGAFSLGYAVEAFTRSAGRLLPSLALVIKAKLHQFRPDLDKVIDRLNEIAALYDQLAAGQDSGLTDRD
jgi:hypothetical protein